MIQYTQHESIPGDYIKEKVSQYLAEDMPHGDKTTIGISGLKKSGTAYVQAESDLILSGLIVTPYFFTNLDIKLLFKDGDSIKKGEIIAKIYGEYGQILSVERAYLNLLQRMSGIATQTSHYAKITNQYNVKTLDTRKTTPGLRLFEKYSVCMGGGFNHRFDLSSGILIKDNHIIAAGSITNAINSIKRMNYKLPIEIEIDNTEQLEEALDSGIDGFLLDNMSPDTIIYALDIIRSSKNKNYFVEASGGITLSNLEEYARTRVDAVSIGALTHSVKAADIHMEFE